MGKMQSWIEGHAMGAVAISFVVGAIAGTALAQPTVEPVSTSAEDQTTEMDEEPEPEPEPVEEPEEEFDRPTKDDFKLKVRTLKNSCFGSAGCNTEIRVILVSTTDIELDPSKTYELTYRLVGADDPLLSTIEVTGDNYTVDEHFISTQQGAKLEAIITRVEAF